MLHLSNNIKRIRHLADLSQSELGFQLTASKDQVASWENGRASPNTLYQEKIALFASVSVDDLLNKELEADDIRIAYNKSTGSVGEYNVMEVIKSKEELISSQSQMIKLLLTDNEKIKSMAETNLNVVLKKLEENQAALDNLTNLLQAQFGKPKVAYSQKIVDQKKGKNADSDS